MMMSGNENVWTKEQTIIAFSLYCRIPFNKCNANHPEVRRVAEIIGRTPAALNFKIGNIGRFDPSLAAKGITGLTHGAHLEEEVWEEFVNDPEALAYESSRLLAQYTAHPIEVEAKIDLDNLPLGEDRIFAVRQRVGQKFFRDTVLASYNNRCCISGVGNTELLEACHILGWSGKDNDKHRTDPRNGLCMNVFFHRAYDRLLIGISPDFELKISEQLIAQTEEKQCRDYLVSINGSKIKQPERFLPNLDFIAQRYEEYKKSV